MKSISDYKNLIREIPVEGLSANIKKASWERIEYKNKTKIENEIFGESESVEISRYDIFKEKNTLKKIVMILMWGYPTGGRGNHIQDILQDINDLCKRFDKIKNKKYNRDYAQIILSE